MSEIIDLSGRRALVTGAGRGHRPGDRPAACRGGRGRRRQRPWTRRPPRGPRPRCRGARPAGRAAVGDLSRTADVHAVCDAAEAALGGIDILVNNAGISLYRSIIDCTEDDWDRHLDIMAKATFLTMRRLAPAMIERGWGRIVNLGSYVAQVNCTTKFFGPYCAAKFAIVGLTQVAAQEFAPAVTVNAVGPGDVDTEMMAARVGPRGRASRDRRRPTSRRSTASG